MHSHTLTVLTFIQQFKLRQLLLDWRSSSFFLLPAFRAVLEWPKERETCNMLLGDFWVRYRLLHVQCWEDNTCGWGTTILHWVLLRREVWATIFLLSCPLRECTMTCCERSLRRGDWRDNGHHHSVLHICYKIRKTITHNYHTTISVLKKDRNFSWDFIYQDIRYL